VKDCCERVIAKGDKVICDELENGIVVNYVPKEWVAVRMCCDDKLVTWNLIQVRLITKRLLRPVI
jgi:hypothetical protein